MAAVLLSVAALVLGVVAFSPAASAKVVAGAITKVTVTPVNAQPNRPFRTDLSWCVPDGTRAGDTFTLTLPTQLGNFPPSFVLKDPASGTVVANATISRATPAVATFTLTDFAQKHQDVCGTAFFTANLNSNAYAGTTQTFTYTTSDGVKFSTPVTIAPKPVIDRSGARKTGKFTSTDQCRDVATDCITWIVETPVGPTRSGSITDTIKAPQTIDCDTVKVLVGDATGSGGAFAHGVTYSGATVGCTTTGITVAYGAVPSGKLLQLSFAVSLPQIDADGGTSYSNVGAKVVNRATNGTVRRDTVSSSIRSAAAGGDGGGVNPAPSITIVKGDTAGNPADTAADAVNLGFAPASTGLAFTITNNGSEPLTNIEVTDSVVANGTVTGLACTFPDGSIGTTWPGPLALGVTFNCTAQLTGVETGPDHEDVATVTGAGQFSGTPVTDHNPYFATAKAPVCVGDYVWVDTNHNGIQDTGEVGIPGVTLTLTDVNGQPVTDIHGQPVGPTKTDSTGKYGFCSLPPGQYTVHIDSSTVPSKYTPTITGQGTRDTDSSTGQSTSLVLTPGDEDLSLDFGFFDTTPVCVGDYVWIDANRNGIQDTGEVGIPGVTLTLTDVNGQPVTDVNGQPVGPTKTDSSGKYGFCSLPPGQYTVHIDNSTVPSDLTPTLTGKGTRDTDSSTGQSTSLVLTPGDEDLTLDFGFSPSGVLPTELTTSPTPTTTPTTTPSSSAGVLPTEITSSSGPGGLASTGSDIGPMLLAVLIAGAAGGLMIFLGRRRIRPHRH